MSLQFFQHVGISMLASDGFGLVGPDFRRASFASLHIEQKMVWPAWAWHVAGLSQGKFSGRLANGCLSFSGYMQSFKKFLSGKIYQFRFQRILNPDLGM